MAFRYARRAMSSAVIVLRYFPVIGRAQALRHALAASGRPFEDFRLPLSEWSTRRMEPGFAGPLRALPTLSWDGTLVSETLPIASFLAKRLGHYEGLDDPAVALRDAIVSSVYMDILLRLVEVIRADAHHPGADPVRSLVVALPRVLQKFERVDASLPEASSLGGERLVMLDFVVAEAYEALCYVLGAERDARLADRLPRAASLAACVRKCPELSRAWESRPRRFTARPDEDVIVSRLRSTDLSALGF
jgi:glutathione S-transferase